ncbi:hypothetical protein JCM3775_001900 [Rhodotorula graminis]|uniref:Zn(2)-C6 fungal-type domain-containing protein n=1 Tax=Rhodotorula graminis (strain WP1) TaxID=578459 RepID=A0A194S5T9_RHOGW|nr:uncharacterized protein RHOBADRAFT_52886 [Rhodotorula graminis WP1]KPV75870.1 hypothetical protein RHOBADRAFT_52886 [Rhodotorula graminis WP1]
MSAPAADLPTGGGASSPESTTASKGKRKANGDDDEWAGGGGAEGGDAASKKRRNRKPVTCAQCRRRKLKCDRGYPCGACRDRQEGHLCEWEGAIRLPQPHLTRDAEAQELRVQLDRLEQLIGGITGAAGAAAGGTPREGGALSGVAEENAAEALGLLAANTSTDGERKSVAVSAAHRAHILAVAPTVQHLVQLLPPKRELDALIMHFLSSELSFFPIVHEPSFRARVHEAQYATLAGQPMLLALFFAIATLEMGWQLTEVGIAKKARTDKELAAKRFFESSMEALRMGGYMEAPNLDVVRTLLTLHRYAEQQSDARTSSLLSQAVLAAQLVGLNREPSTAGVVLSHIEVEERRRLWRIIICLDWLDTSGRPCLVTHSQFDTREPTNAFDANITDDGVLASAQFDFTPSLYTVTLTQLAYVGHSIKEYIYAVKAPSLPTWKVIVDQNATLARLKASLPVLKLDGDSVVPLEAKNFATDRLRVFLHMAVLQLVVRLNRPFLSRGFADQRLAEGRLACINAAHGLMSLWLGYPDSHAMSRFHVPLFHCLNGLVIAALDLFQDPLGAHADKHRRLVARVSMRLEARDHKSDLVVEVLGIVEALQRHSLTSDLGGEHLPAFDYGPLSPSTVFSRSLPLALTADPFVPFARAERERVAASLAAGGDEAASTAAAQGELAGLWDALADEYGAVYAAPDAREWGELVRAQQSGGKPWEAGVDILA